MLEDDIDGSVADETVTFALDGVTYEIDLNAKNAAALRDALAPYVGHAGAPAVAAQLAVRLVLVAPQARPG